MKTGLPDSQGLLVIPHLRVQNANAISSPLTHGFPAMSAFLGLMWALARRLDVHRLPLAFDSVGVICHDFDEQTTEGGYTKAFHLTRNPVDKDGSTAAIVEEGRIHLDVTLVFGVSGSFAELDAAQRQAIADLVATEVGTMRVAGGSVLPPAGPEWRSQPELLRLAEDSDAAQRQFRRLRRRWLPGFALVSRDDLLQARFNELRAANPAITALDALLDLSRFNWRAVQSDIKLDAGAGTQRKVEWQHDRTQGWIVPIPVGYGALSPLHPAGSVLNARDRNTDFRFVESLYSVGQWLGPHHLTEPRQLLWYCDNDVVTGHYRCRNDFAPIATTQNA